MPDQMLPQEWTRVSDDVLDLEAVRRLYAKRGPHRVARSQYPTGATFRGAARSGECYVLDGSCRYRFDHVSIDLHRGQFAELPGGDYVFEVLGPSPVVIVRAWKIPDSVLG